MAWARLLFITVSAVILVIAAVVTSRKGTGFDETYLFDWLDILIFPIVVTGGVYWLDPRQRDHEERLAAQQREREVRSADRRAQDAALQAYLEHMSHLLTKENLRQAEKYSDIRVAARARTLTLLEQLDENGKMLLMRFLHEANLIKRNDPNPEKDIYQYPVIGLKEANLSGANVSGDTLDGDVLEEASLRKTKLKGASLKGTYLQGADLRGADLRGADLSHEQIGEAIGNPTTQLPDHLQHPEAWSMGVDEQRERLDKQQSGE
jgi:hypothetical protein